LDECHARRSYVDIKSFFVWVLEIRSVVTEKLSGGEAEAARPGDLERSETMDVRVGHKLFTRINLVRYF